MTVSTQPWNVEGGPYEVADDLIVGLPHLAQVLAQLNDMGIEHEAPEESQPLGLARLRLVNAEAAARTTMKLLREDPAALKWTEGFPSRELPIDQVLWGLRGLFAASNAGWTPTLGKNRMVGRVHGVGEISHGGGGAPEMVAARPTLPGRASGPGRGVRVGVLDTGLSQQPWLAGGWVARFSDTDSDNRDALFSEGHATFIAGLVLSQAPGATVEVRRLLDGEGRADSWTAAQEIVRLGRSGLDVLNLSFVCYSEDGQPPMVLSAAIDRLDPDLVVVAAAGNHGSIEARGAASAGSESPVGSLSIAEQRRKPAWPAALDDVVAVGACNDDGTRAAFSPDAAWVDVHAAGVRLLSTYLGRAKEALDAEPIDFGGFARWSGTSFAAALVSGAVAAGTEPGRVTSRAALVDILGSLGSGGSPGVAHTHAPYLRLRTL